MCGGGSVSRHEITHIRRSVVRDDTELGLTQWHATERRPPCLGVSRRARGCVRTVQHSLHPDLSNAHRNLAQNIRRHGGSHDDRRVEPHVLHALIIPGDRIREYAECRVSERIVSSRSGEVCNLYWHVGSGGQHLVKENARFGSTVLPLLIQGCVHMNHDRHVKTVRGLEDPSHLRNVVGIVEIDVRVAEVQLQPEVQLRILAAARQFFQRVRLERVETAERAQPVRVLRYLARRPVVLRLYVFVFVVNGPAARLAPCVRNRQHECAVNACRVE